LKPVLTVSVQVWAYSVASAHGVRVSSEDKLGSVGSAQHILCF